ncbi:MAG: hypothetical protein ACW9XH_08120 [Candidatus Nitrosopumilus sp. bin_32a]
MIQNSPDDSQLRNMWHDICNWKSESKENKKSWNPMEPLEWDIFKKDPPEEETEETANIFCYMEPYWKISIDEDNNEFRFQSIKVFNIMLKTHSWVQERGKNSQGLRHERGHFDLNQYFVMDFNKKSQIFLEQTLPIPSGDLSLKERADDAAMVYAMRFYYPINEERISFQKKCYEVETEHGTNIIEQKKWEEKITDMISSHNTNMMV